MDFYLKKKNPFIIRVVPGAGKSSAQSILTYVLLWGFYRANADS